MKFFIVKAQDIINMPGRSRLSGKLRFPPNKIKKIMQEDEEVGKIAAPVPAMISRSLDIFISQLLQQAGEVARDRGARTLTPSHLKSAIMNDQRMDFLQNLVENVPLPATSSVDSDQEQSNSMRPQESPRERIVQAPSANPGPSRKNRSKDDKRGGRKGRKKSRSQDSDPGVQNQDPAPDSPLDLSMSRVRSLEQKPSTSSTSSSYDPFTSPVPSTSGASSTCPAASSSSTPSPLMPSTSSKKSPLKSPTDTVAPVFTMNILDPDMDEDYDDY